MTDQIPSAGGLASPVAEPGPTVAEVDVATRRHDDLRFLLQFIVLLQAMVLAGGLVVFLQFDGLPDRVAQRVPTNSDAGEVMQVESLVQDLTNKVDMLTGTVDDLQRTLNAHAVSSPTPRP